MDPGIPKILSSNPHLEEVGPFKRWEPPTHLLDHCHTLCLWLAMMGFSLSFAGVHNMLRMERCHLRVGLYDREFRDEPVGVLLASIVHAWARGEGCLVTGSGTARVTTLARGVMRSLSDLRDRST